MDRAIAILPGAGGVRWAESQSQSSDDSLGDTTSEQPPQLSANAWNISTGSTNLQAGQLSPASTSMEAQVESSSALAMMNSAPSSCAESWPEAHADIDEGDPDMSWEKDSDDAEAIPKIEPMDEDFNFDALKHTPLAPSAPAETSASLQTKQKRPRGRPRKHPLTPVISNAKITKGRSKTGCITCRKRKKKCDEAKPRCMNCEKNAVVCEGYHEKQIWKSGRERAEEERVRRASLPSITMQPLFHGVETVEDKIFWRHYINQFSNVLTVETEARNAFKDIILHLANRHQGLMHSILSVSSKHIDFEAPYGIKLLQDNPSTSRQALELRSDYHHDEATKRFYENISTSVEKDDPEYCTEEYQSILCARYGQILCRLLQTRAEGNSTGEHRLHLKAYQTLIQHSPPEDPAFYAFITEIFQYHIYADELIWHPDTRAERLSSNEWRPFTTAHSPRLLGVVDGLLHQLSDITDLRNTIRRNMATSVDPPVDYIMLFRAAAIDSAIEDWNPEWPAGDSRNRVGLLYKQVMFIYLFRTIYPPSSTPRSTYSSLSSQSSSVSSTPQRRASVAASIASTVSAAISTSTTISQGLNLSHSCPSSRNPSRHNSMHEGDARSGAAGDLYSSQAASPPPKRRPANDDHRLSTAVEDSLQLLESFGPSDPAQTLLLIPCFVVGIACFNEDRRERVRKSMKAVRGYTGLRQCDRVAELLEGVWALMDEGDWVAVWDWQCVARRLGVDIPCT